MNTSATATTTINAPMVHVRPRRAAAERKSIDDLLEDARTSPEHGDWWFLFDSHSLLHVPGLADRGVCAELISSAPNERLAGYVEGLYVRQQLTPIFNAHM